MLMDNDTSYCSNIARKKFILYIYKNHAAVNSLISKSILQISDEWNFFQEFRKNIFEKNVFYILDCYYLAYWKVYITIKLLQTLTHKLIDQWICIEHGNANKFCALLLLQQSSRIKSASSVYNTYFQNGEFCSIFPNS